MPASDDLRFALSVYRKMQRQLIADYLNEIPEEEDDEDISVTTMRNIKKAVTPKSSDSAILAKLRMLIFQEYREAINSNNFTVLVPESWQMKVGEFRPQLRVGLGEVIQDKVTPAKWSFTIPHYRHKDPKGKPRIPGLHKGNHWCRYTLNDNSKIYINAIDANEGKQFIADIINLVNPLYLPNGVFKREDIAHGTRGGTPIREVRTRPVAAAYFEKALKDSEGYFQPKLEHKWTMVL